eukprot:symbB.v1.2.040291.t1/scaffold7126.1/size13177/1
MVLLRLQLGWIYFDAGYGKVMGEWSWSTELPALAVYLQGAPFGRDLIHWDRQLLDGFLVRLLTVLAAWVEVFVGPVMLVALNAPRWVGFLPIIMVILLHIGIAFCMEGGMAIGFVAIATWLALLPQPHQPHASVKGSKRCQDAMLGDVANGHARLGFGDTVALCWCLASFGFALSGLPSQPGPIPTVLLLNRWQVFSGAERTMNWEVAPARLANGDIVNLWTWQNVSFAKPSRYGRRGRWMSFPSTRPASPKALEARFRYLCTEWNVAHSVPVLKYQLFELWASLGPNLETLPPFKTLVHVQDCDPEKDGVVALPAAGNIPLSTAQAIRVAFHEGCHERI